MCRDSVTNVMSIFLARHVPDNLPIGPAGTCCFATRNGWWQCDPPGSPRGSNQHQHLSGVGMFRTSLRSNKGGSPARLLKYTQRLSSGVKKGSGKDTSCSRHTGFYIPNPAQPIHGFPTPGPDELQLVEHETTSLSLRKQASMA